MKRGIERKKPTSNLRELSVEEYKTMYERIKTTHNIMQVPNVVEGKVLLTVTQIYPIKGAKEQFIILSGIAI